MKNNITHSIADLFLIANKAVAELHKAKNPKAKKLLRDLSDWYLSVVGDILIDDLVPKRRSKTTKK